MVKDHRVSRTARHGKQKLVIKLLYFLIDQGGQRKICKHIGEPSPDMVVAIFTEAFIVKSVDFVDFLALVISSKDGHSVFVSALQSQNKREHFDTMVTSINVVTHE